jgi:hypothetical protein
VALEIIKLSAHDIDHLGPDPEVCKSFYRAELPDHALSDFWFLTRSGTRDRLPMGFIDVHEALAFRAESAPAGASISFFPINDPFDIDDPGGGIDSENDREDVLELYWEPLLAIALWSSDLFRVPVIMLSERDVQLRRVATTCRFWISPKKASLEIPSTLTRGDGAVSVPSAYLLNKAYWPCANANLFAPLRDVFFALGFSAVRI